MKQFVSSEFREINRVRAFIANIRGLESLTKRGIGHLNRHLNLLNDTPSFIVAQVRGVSDREGNWGDQFDLAWLSVVELCHSLNLLESDPVSRGEGDFSSPDGVIYSNSAVLVLSDDSAKVGLAFLSVFISDIVLFSEVNEGESGYTKGG